MFDAAFLGFASGNTKIRPTTRAGLVEQKRGVFAVKPE